MPPRPTDLNPHEIALIAAVEGGKAWGSDSAPTPEQLADADFVANLPVIRATTIRALCLGEWDDVTVGPRGVVVVGALIVGQLDFVFTTVPVPLGLVSCHIYQNPNFLHSQLKFLFLSGSRLESGLLLESCRIEGDLLCRDGFTATGTVSLQGARIGGSADFKRAVLNGNDSPALVADGAKIEGRLICDNITATGVVSLISAIIGSMNFCEAKLNGNGGKALNADITRITGNLLFRRAVAIGDVCFVGAKIAGNAEFNDAVLDGGEGAALRGEGVNIKGYLFCRHGFKVTGHVDLTAAHVERGVYWTPVSWRGSLILAHARVGQWRDSWTPTGWPGGDVAKIDLRDFAYGGFGKETPNTDVDSRIAWIEHSLGKNFVPGPYETLARVLKANGDDDGAKAVALAKNRHRTRYHSRKDVTPRLRTRLRHRIGGWFRDKTIGYGYLPWRGLIWLAGFAFAGTALFTGFGPAGAESWRVIKPAIPIVYVQSYSQASLCSTAEDPACRRIIEDTADRANHAISYRLPTEYPPFSGFWYSLDTLIPLVDLGQESAWSPSPVGGFFDDIAGWLILIYLYVHIIAGWILTTVTVVAMTGLIKKND